MGISSKVAKKLKMVYLTKRAKSAKKKYNKAVGLKPNSGVAASRLDIAKSKISNSKLGQKAALAINTKKRQVLSTLKKAKKQILSPLKPAPRVLGRKVQMVAWDAKRAPPKGFVPPIINTTKTYRPK